MYQRFRELIWRLLRSVRVRTGRSKFIVSRWANERMIYVTRGPPDASSNYSALICTIPERRELQRVEGNAVLNNVFWSSYPEFGNSCRWNNWNTWWEPEAGNTCSPPAKQPRSESSLEHKITSISHTNTHISLLLIAARWKTDICPF